MIKHLTVLAAVDGMSAENGGLEVVDGSHLTEIKLGEDRCIEPAWVQSQKWTSCDLQPGSLASSSISTHIKSNSDTDLNNAGDILVFGSYLAHRSGKNLSGKDRRAIYATYNCKAEGDLHDDYYEDRRKLWPPTHLREEGEAYEEGRLRYGYGSPMLTIEGQTRAQAAA